jgi:hypothetical protein
MENDSIEPWVSVYEQALAEPSAEKSLAKIEDAERAIKRALRKAIEEGSSTTEQRKALENALRVLQERRTSGRSATGSLDKKEKGEI